MTMNKYTPVLNGNVQGAYYDQMATALAGDVYSPADVDLVDSYIAVDASGNGIPAGVCVVASAATDAPRPGNNGLLATLAPANATVVEGITVRNQQMQSNSAGVAVWFDKRVVSVMRLNRIGGRIWATLGSGTAVVGNQVYMLADGSGQLTSISTNNLLLPGVFFASAGTGVVLIECGRR
jgi:hypothetical protein